MQAAQSATTHTLQFVASATASSAGTAALSVTIPATARAGDLAILCHGHTSQAATLSTNTTLPTGFTLIAQSVSASTVGVGIQSAYRILTSADVPGTTTIAGTASLNGGAAGSAMILMIFRSPRLIRSLTVNGANSSQATTAAPTNQAITGGTVTQTTGAIIQVAHWMSTAAVTTRGNTLTGASQVAGAVTRQYVQYLITNTIDAGVVGGTISTTDVGTNGMQCFCYNVL